MNIDDLTLGQVKALNGLLGGSTPKGSFTPGRYVVVVDRGWIFAGDCSVTQDGYLKLDNAIHVFSWPGGGFSKMVEDPKGTKADLRPVASVEVPMDAIIFRVPVTVGWGVK